MLYLEEDYALKLLSFVFFHCLVTIFIYHAKELNALL